MNFLCSLFKTSFDPSSMRKKQWTVYGLGVVAIFLMGIFMFWSFFVHTPSSKAPKKEEELPMKAVPTSAINPSDIWINRVEKAVEKALEANKNNHEANVMIQKRMDHMEKLLQRTLPSAPYSPSNTTSIDPSFSNVAPQDFIPPALDTSDSPSSSQDISPTNLKGEDVLLKNGETRDHSSGLIHLSLSKKRKLHFKNIDTYIPCGTYAKAVLTSGIVTSTTIGESAHPRPIILRLVDDGHLPQGFQGIMNNNVMIGECHADLSSERVYCTVTRMSWVEADGTTVEKPVEAWIIGEDGRPGVRGEVVDRSIDAVKDTFIAGLLSGVSNFLKFDATNPSFTPSLTERGSTLKTGQAAKAAGATGVGNALDKLVDYSIKRAEQLQPVIQIASGRVVDIVFRNGVDTRPEIMEPLKLVTHTEESKETEVIYDKES